MLFNDIITAYRAPLIEDVYGASRDWEAARVVYSGPASVQPRSSAEDRIDGEGTITEAVVFIRSGDIRSSDRLLISGEWWEVDGVPLRRGLKRLRYLRVSARRVA